MPTCLDFLARFKGQYHQFLASINTKSHKTHEYRWKSTNNHWSSDVKMAIVLHRNYNKCFWLRMARMEVDSNLKTPGRFFEVFALVFQIK